MKKVWIGVVLLIMVAFLNGLFGKGSMEVGATWLWNPWDIASDEAGTLAFLENKNVNKVYVQIDPQLPMGVYRGFIEKAAAQDLAVYALEGAPDWVAEKGEASQDQLMAWLKDYQTGSSELQKFAGIHLDVEPYLYSEWSTNQEAAILAYQHLLIKAQTHANSLDLPLEADMPFWFDEVPYHNALGKGLLAEWVIANTSSVTIMAYRDTAPLIIELVKNEVEFAAKHGKSAIVGIETAPTDEGDALTFFEEGEAYMNSQLAEVQAHYKGTPGYGGIAVHNFASWKTMSP